MQNYSGMNTLQTFINMQIFFVSMRKPNLTNLKKLFAKEPEYSVNLEYRLITNKNLSEHDITQNANVLTGLAKAKRTIEDNLEDVSVSVSNKENDSIILNVPYYYFWIDAPDSEKLYKAVDILFTTAPAPHQVVYGEEHIRKVLPKYGLYIRGKQGWDRDIQRDYSRYKEPVISTAQ